ncbi:MAG: TldD/PmbA family protein, partial [Deltaproteobacteria bacterium]
MKHISELLEKTLAKSPYWTEARYHRRNSQSLSVQKGLVKQAKSNLTSGVGIRVLVDGAWGFSSTSDLTADSLERSLKLAIECAKSLSQLKKAQVKKLPESHLAKGEFKISGYDLLKQMPLEQKLQAVLKAEEETRKNSSLIQSATCVYNELFEDKVVITTDGAHASSNLARSEIKLGAIASKDGEMAESHESVGKTGSWECLFSKNSLAEMSQSAAKLAVDLLSAPKIPGGTATLILSPAMVGLLSHEAIGHTVEADFVLSGSVAKDKIGTQVASPLVTLSDSGTVNGIENTGGELLVDDEGVLTTKTTIIKNGVLNSYLHNRESAAIFGVT